MEEYYRPQTPQKLHCTDPMAAVSSAYRSKNLPAQRLYVMGINHLDPKGAERLNIWLRLMKPDVLYLDTSVNAFNAKVKQRRQKKYNLLKKDKTRFNALLCKILGQGGMQMFHMLGPEETQRKEPDTPAEKLLETYGYEMLCAYDYVKEVKPGCKVLAINDDKSTERINNIITKEFKELFAKILQENEDALEEYQRQVDETYALFEQKKPTIEDPWLLKQTRRCDDLFEKRIRKNYNKLGDNICMAVCSNIHLFGAYGNNLYERLKDLVPIRMQVIDLDF